MHGFTSTLAGTALAVLPLLANAHPAAVARDWLPGVGDTSLPEYLKLNELYGAPDNDFNCTSSHNPVIMLHGLSADREVDLNMLQKWLNAQGYCTYSKTYGAHTLVPWIGGVTAMADSAVDIAAWIHEVRDKTGASKVDIVGHSEGGVMALYVPLTQPGVSAIVERTVSLGPAVYGAQYFGFTQLWYIGGDVTRALVQAVLDVLGVPAADDMATGGRVYNDFAAAKGHIVQPGVKATIVMSRSDTLVAPATSEIDEPGVRNVFVQDYCPDDKVGHAGLMWDRSVWGIILNELSENYNGTFACDQGLEI